MNDVWCTQNVRRDSISFTWLQPYNNQTALFNQIALSTSVDIKNTRYKRIPVTHSRSESAREQRIALYKSEEEDEELVPNMLLASEDIKQKERTKNSLVVSSLLQLFSIALIPVHLHFFCLSAPLPPSTSNRSHHPFSYRKLMQ